MAPPGTSITSAVYRAWAEARDGWQASIYRVGGNASGASWLNCPGGEGCQANPGNQWISGPGYNATAAVANLRCARAVACTALAALQVAGNVSIGVQDETRPTMALSGAAASGEWIAGTPTVTVDASDNTGIRATVLRIDGTQQRTVEHGCDFRFPVPCGNQRTSLDIPSTVLPDGPHTLTISAVDPAGNVGSVTQRLLADNSAPGAALSLDVDGGRGWRPHSVRRIAWVNPLQHFAPIAAARYSLCPAPATDLQMSPHATERKSCVTGDQRLGEIGEIPHLTIPRPGLWTLRLWLVDAAGNADPEAATVIDDVGYDPTPPQLRGFVAQDPSDPARLFLQADEDLSPLAAGSIEIRHRGARTWRPLETDIRTSGITALIDDERLRRGMYFVRASVHNGAGLEQSTDRDTDGKVKMVKLPVRMASALRAGRRSGKSCRHRGRRSHCKWKLRSTVPLRLGERVQLHGTLRVHGRPVPRQTLEVWERPRLSGGAWQRVGSAQTDQRGNFRFWTGNGVARRIRFRYSGSRHIRGDSQTVALNVEAETMITVSRRRVANGEYVHFSGRLAGKHRPAAGVLVELQVRTRAKWRTFAQPRADGATGMWRYAYRFETVRGRAIFRFRARVRSQAGFPFVTGTSRTVVVRVQGL